MDCLRLSIFVCWSVVFIGVLMNDHSHKVSHQVSHQVTHQEVAKSPSYEDMLNDLSKYNVKTSNENSSGNVIAYDTCDQLGHCNHVIENTNPIPANSGYIYDNEDHGYYYTRYGSDLYLDR